MFVKHNGFVQFGCGPNAPHTAWTDFDASPTLRIQKIPLLGRVITSGMVRFSPHTHYGDIVKGLPIEAASCKAIYCSHVLEHLSLEDATQAMRHVYGYLSPGGIFRCVVPDLERYVTDYLQSTSPDAAIHFMRATLLGEAKRGRGLMGVLRYLVGNAAHRWMWDFKSLKSSLEEAGFVEIRRAAFADSMEPLFGQVEVQGRWCDALGVECVRPSMDK